LECKESKRKDFHYIEQRDDGYYGLVSNGDYLVFLDYNQFEHIDKVYQVFKDIFKWIKAEEYNYYVKM